MHKNNFYLLIHILKVSMKNKTQALFINSKLDLKSSDNPIHFYWEVVYRNKHLFFSPKKQWANITFEIIAFLFRNNNIDKIEIIFWKLNKKKEIYIGQFDLAPEDFL